MFRVLCILILLGRCLYAASAASGTLLSEAFEPISASPAARPSGVVVCDRVIEELNQLLAYRNFDQYILTPDNPNNPAVDYEAYDPKKQPDLMQFYSESSEERAGAHLRLQQRFTKAVKKLSSLSHTHPEFEILFFFANDPMRVMNERLRTDFQRVFQDTNELAELRNVAYRLKAVSQAIDGKESKQNIKAKELEVSNALQQIPVIMTLAQSFYLPAIQKTYASMLGDYDHRTFSGRAAMTRVLINYGELLKTIPDKKASDIGKACIMFRDKAVKVLSRRLEALQGDTMIASYEGLLDTMRELNAYIFGGASVTAPNPTRIRTVLEAWGYRPNGKPIATTASAAVNPDDDSEVDEAFMVGILQKMRELSGLRVRLRDMAFFDEIELTWSRFNEEISEFLSEVRNRTLATISDGKERQAKEAQLKQEHEKQLTDFNIKIRRLQQWPEILHQYDLKQTDQTGTAINGLNGWFDTVRSELIHSFKGDAEVLDKAAMTKARIVLSRPLHIRLQLRTQHLRTTPGFDSTALSAYILMTSSIHSLQEDRFEALRLLAYTFTHTVKENISALGALKAFEPQLIALRNFWAHPRLTEYNWSGILSVDGGSTKMNESRAMAVLMVRCEDVL